MIAGPRIAEALIAGDEWDLDVTELPVQFGPLPANTPAPPASTWTAGTLSPLRKVTRHIDGAAAATVAIVTVADQAPFEVTHPDATTLGRREVALDFGDVSTASGRTWARRYLATAALAREAITIELIPEVGPQPYRDFGIGDNISVLDEAHRVVSIGFHVGVASVIEWTVELDQPRLLLEERLASIMRRQHPGSAGGRTVLPARTDPQFPGNSAGTERMETWSANVAPGAVVLRKNGTPITGASVTVSVGTTGRAVLKDAARKFTKKVDKFDFTIAGVAGFPELVIPDGRWIQEMQVTGSTNGVSITLLVA